MDSGFRRLDSGFHAYGFRIPNFLRFRILKFLTPVFIHTSKANILQFKYEVLYLNRKVLSKRSKFILISKARVNADASISIIDNQFSNLIKRFFDYHYLFA